MPDWLAFLVALLVLVLVLPMLIAWAILAFRARRPAGQRHQQNHAHSRDAHHL